MLRCQGFLDDLYDMIHFTSQILKKNAKKQQKQTSKLSPLKHCFFVGVQQKVYVYYRVHSDAFLRETVRFNHSNIVKNRLLEAGNSFIKNNSYYYMYVLLTSE